MKKENGITLVALVITIIVLLIIASISINYGTGSLDNTRLQGFYTKMEIIQKRVDDIAVTNESYVNNDGEVLYIKHLGKNLTEEQQNFVQNILLEKSINVPIAEFRYFTLSDLQNILDLSEMDQNVFIHFDSRTIIAEDGITIGDTTYYMLENNVYFSEYKGANLPTLNGEVPFSYSIIEYGTDKYKVTVKPNYNIENYNPKGVELKYKKSTSKYWETSTNLEMIINGPADYNIIYEDINNNSLSKTINVSVDENGIPTVTEI